MGDADGNCLGQSYRASEDGIDGVRDIYRLEFELFKDGRWVWFYLFAVSIFTTHVCVGWTKAVAAPAMGIPTRHQRKAAHIGMVITAFIAFIYVTFPMYCYYNLDMFPT